MSSIYNLSFDPATALPRSNGELVFEEPWESRAFGMAVALADLGVFDWKDYQACLISVIGEHDRSGDPSEPYRYYEHWLTVLELLVVEHGLVTAQDIDKRATDLCQRPHGHDHRDG